MEALQIWSQVYFKTVKYTREYDRLSEWRGDSICTHLSPTDLDFQGNYAKNSVKYQASFG